MAELPMLEESLGLDAADIALWNVARLAGKTSPHYKLF